AREKNNNKTNEIKMHNQKKKKFKKNLFKNLDKKKLMKWRQKNWVIPKFSKIFRQENKLTLLSWGYSE
ncbi:UNVERIFIED_CONTAM: hypothetical protein NY603_19615, partial [Bacteroidetes bacterium 56_B9]